MAADIFFASIYLTGHLMPLIQIANYMQQQFPQHTIYFATEDVGLAKIKNQQIVRISLGNNTCDSHDNEIMRKISQVTSENENMKLTFATFSAFAVEQLKILYPHFLELQKQNKLPKLLVADMATIAMRTLAYDFGIELVLTHPSLFMRQFAPVWEPKFMSGASYPMTLWQKMGSLSQAIRILYFGVIPTFAALDTVRMQYGKPALNPLEAFDVPTTSIYGTVQGFDYVFPLLPNEFAVGALIPAEYPPLTEELEQFLSQGKTIYVSFGTLAHLTGEQLQRIQHGLEKANVQAIWVLAEFNQKHVKSSDKVKILKWAPQLSVLKHANISLFFTHCGGNSVHESLYFGKPLIGMPFFGDQLDIAVRLRVRKVGYVLDKNQFTADSIAHAVTTIMNDAEYTTNAQYVAKLMYHAGGVARAAKLLDEFADVGLKHVLQEPVPWYYKWCLDILAVLVALPIAVLVLFCNYCCCRSRVTIKNNAHVKHE